jgi:hypothetical protein
LENRIVSYPVKTGEIRPGWLIEVVTPKGALRVERLLQRIACLKKDALMKTQKELFQSFSGTLKRATVPVLGVALLVCAVRAEAQDCNLYPIALPANRPKSC